MTMDFTAQVKSRLLNHEFHPICIEAKIRKEQNKRSNKKWNKAHPEYNRRKKREAYWKLTEDERREINRKKRERMKELHGEDYYKKISRKYRESENGKAKRNEYRLAHMEQNRQNSKAFRERHGEEYKAKHREWNREYQRRKRQQKKLEQSSTSP